MITLEEIARYGMETGAEGSVPQLPANGTVSPAAPAAGSLFLHTLENGETFLAPQPQFAGQPPVQTQEQGGTTPAMVTSPVPQGPSTPMGFTEGAPGLAAPAQTQAPQQPQVAPQSPAAGSAEVPAPPPVPQTLEELAQFGVNTQPQAPQSPIQNYLAGANRGLATLLGLPFDVPMGVLSELGVKIVKSDPSLEDIVAGKTEYKTWDVGNEIAAAMRKIGINTTPDEGSLAGQMGDQTTKGVATALTLIASAPALAARFGTSFVGKIFDAIQKSPYLTILQELGAAPGAVIGGEGFDARQQPVGNLGASIIGGMAGGAAVTGVGALAMGAKRGLDALTEGIVNMGRARPGAMGAPMPDPLRDPLADVTQPRRYAEYQIQGALQQVEDAIGNAIRSVPRQMQFGRGGRQKVNAAGQPLPMSVEESQVRVRNALEAAEDYGRKIESRYWGRVNLRRPVPPDQVFSDMDKFVTDLNRRGSHESYIPRKEVEEIRDLFSGAKPPSISAVRSMVRHIDDLRRAETSIGGAQRTELAANWARLQGILNDAVADAYPNDIPLEQARQFSRKFNDLFSRGPVADVMMQRRSGAEVIDPAQTTTVLMNRFGGIRNATQVQKDLSNLEVAPSFPQAQPGPGGKWVSARPSDPALQGLTEELEASVGTIFRDAVAEDPQAATKWISANREKVKDLANLTRRLDHVADELQMQQSRRHEINRSYLAKYIEGDPQAAAISMFNHRDSPAYAKELMATLKGDPSAVAGLQAEILDYVLKRTGGDPKRFNGYLLDGKVRRTMEQIFAPEQMARLDKLAKAGLDVENVRGKDGGVPELLARIAGARVSGLIPGVAGSIQTAALGSAWMRDRVRRMLQKMPTHEMLHNAISDPAWEKALLQEGSAKVPADKWEKIMLRLIRAEEGTRQAAEDWAQAEDARGGRGRESYMGPSTPLRATTPEEGTEVTLTGISTEEEPAFTADMMRQSDVDVFTAIGRLPRGNAFLKAVEEFPESGNIEDRRGVKGRTLGSYRSLVNSMDAAGYTQVPELKSFLKRKGDQFPGGVIPTPRRRGNEPYPEPESKGKVLRDIERRLNFRD